MTIIPIIPNIRFLKRNLTEYSDYSILYQRKNKMKIPIIPSIRFLNENLIEYSVFLFIFFLFIRFTCNTLKKLCIYTFHQIIKY